MNADQIEERLLYELRGTRHDDVFTGASAVDLVFLLKTAARTMVAEQRTEDADLAVALGNMHVFLAEMDAQRARLHLSEFHEETVSATTGKLCPGFWPFC